MKNMEDDKVYTEVLVVLETFNLVEYIPENLVEKMRKYQDKNYEYTFDCSIPIEEQRISKRAAAILSVLYLKYICDDDAEILELKKIYESNDI